MYFSQTNYISNSDLTAFKKQRNLIEPRDLSKVFNFGNLVDAHITEQASIERFAALHDEDDNKKAELMKEAALADPALKLFLQDCKLQHEVYRKQFLIEYDGSEIRVPMKCKLDLLKKPIRAGADIKTTDCISKAAFIESISFFDYDRQGALYMDLAGLDSFMFIGISKKKNRITKKHEVYKYAMIREDETYNRGKAKYSFLAFNYYYLIYNFEL